MSGLMDKFCLTKVFKIGQGSWTLNLSTLEPKIHHLNHSTTTRSLDERVLLIVIFFYYIHLKLFRDVKEHKRKTNGKVVF